MNKKQHLHRILRNNSGIAAMEFSIIVFALFIMFAMINEYMRYAYLTQSVDKMTTQIADVVAQQTVVDVQDLNTLFTVSEEMMHPARFRGSMHFMMIANYSTTQPVTFGSGVPHPSVRCRANTPCIKYHCQFNAGGVSHGTELAPGGHGHISGLRPIFPRNSTGIDYGRNMYPNEKLFVLDMYYYYTPTLPGIGLIFDFLNIQWIHRTYFFKPRYSELDDIIGC